MKRRRHLFGGNRTFHFDGLHPDFATGLTELERRYNERAAECRRTGEKGASSSINRRHVARRFGDWLSTNYPGLAPNAFTKKHAREHQNWVKLNTPVGRNDRTYNGAHDLFNLLLDSGLRDDALGDPFGSAKGVDQVPLPPLPARTKQLFDLLEAHTESQAELKCVTAGGEGWSAGYSETIAAAPRFLLHWMNERNTKLPAELRASDAWPLTFDFIYSDLRPITDFMRASPVYGKARGDSLSERSRKARFDNLTSAYEFLHEREGVGDADFVEKITKVFKPKRHRKISFGGRGPRDILALEEEEVLRCLRQLDSWVADGDAKIAAGTATELDCADTYLLYGTFELTTWTGIRKQGVASLDLAEITQIKETGSWVSESTRVKSRNSPNFKRWWLPRRSIKWFRRYLRAKGLALVEADLTDEKKRELAELRRRPMPTAERERRIRELMWGPGIALDIDDVWFETKITEPRVVYPLMTDTAGNLIGHRAIGERLSRLLVATRCRHTHPHVLRHTMCHLYLNRFKRSPREIMTIGDWATEAMVLRHYPKREATFVYRDFDALTDLVCRTTPSGLTGRAIRATLTAAIDFMTGVLTEDGETQLRSAWTGFVRILDDLARVDPNATAPSELITMTPAEFDDLDRAISEQTGRKLSLRKLLGGFPRRGLRMPEFPADHPSELADEAA